MNLREWLRDNCQTRAEFAQRVGVSVHTVGSWITGERFPRPQQMRAIISATDGGVSVADMLAAARKKPGEQAA